EIRIKLGEGGVWTNRDLAINGNASHQAMPGPDGTDTVITMNNKTILVAKGGKGGKQALKTHRYDLCYAKAGICKKGSLEINCCEKEQGTRSTRDILATTGQMSPFENIKAIVGKSLVVGTGLGRGGDGTGSRAGFEENYGFRAFVNASGHNVTYPVASVHYPNHDNEINNTPPAGFNKDTDYDNKPLPPSELNFKGGGGGVIITW
ncbi:MAG: hypothetical protein IJB79_02510, partial [Candidatus Gastranaerophilales bacterium]|nr:hypothetical protein [Candidatus Gastranaerophilales bacterium]